jgi:ribosomal protein S12
MRFKVIKVNGVSLEMLRTGRAEKKRRWKYVKNKSF